MSRLRNAHDVHLERAWESCRRGLEAISAEITRIPGVTTSFHVPDVANHVPHMNIVWDTKKVSISPRDASAALRLGKPSIVLSSSQTGPGLSMCSFMLKPGEENIIAAQLVQLFKAHSA